MRGEDVYLKKTHTHTRIVLSFYVSMIWTGIRIRGLVWSLLGV